MSAWEWIGLYAIGWFICFLAFRVIEDDPDSPGEALRSFMIAFLWPLVLAFVLVELPASGLRSIIRGKQ